MDKYVRECWVLCSVQWKTRHRIMINTRNDNLVPHPFAINTHYLSYAQSPWNQLRSWVTRVALWRSFILGIPFCKLCGGVVTVVRSPHPHMNCQHNKKMTIFIPLPTWTIFVPQSNHPQIAWLMSLWVEIHVGLMFIVILIEDEWVRRVGRNSCINPKWVAWKLRVRGDGEVNEPTSWKEGNVPLTCELRLEMRWDEVWLIMEIVDVDL